VVITPDGYALSNFHVTKPAGDYMKCSMADGRLYDAVIVGIDPTGDVALIKLLGRDDFPCAEFADSDQVQVGDWCFAVGNPFLLATDFQPTVTFGLVSGIHRYQGPAGTLLEYADCIQTDASINPGNSGGPLFNADGQLIGINGRGSFEKRGRVNVGVGYAISINQIQNFLGYLRSGRIVDHATLGATVASDEDGRVVVTNLLESSDAYRRGLRYGDEILSFGGRQVTTVNGFKNVLGIFPKGWRVPLSFRQDGTRRDVYVRLMGVHAPGELLEKLEGAMPSENPQPKPDPKRKIVPRPKGEPGPAPKFKPIERPRDKPDGGPGQPDTPKRPQSKPNLAKPKPDPIPEHVKPLIEQRKGYANYHFNRLNRDRIWKAALAHGDFTSLSGTWKLTATDDGGQDVAIDLGRDKVIGSFAGEVFEVDAAKDLGAQLDPPRSGGLLVALHVWQRLLSLGPEQFGDVWYLGTAPMADREGLYDVLVGTHDIVETRFYFEPSSGVLAGLEMFPDSQVDPCEIYLEDYRDVDGRQVPHVLLIRYGDEIYARLELTQFQPVVE
jgi:S1-C subfamily serine protease